MHLWLMRQHTSKYELKNQRSYSLLVFRHDYIKHALDKPRSFKPEEVYVPRGEFDALTSYNKEYTRMSNE